MSAYDVSSKMLFQNYDYENGNMHRGMDVQRCSTNFRPEKAVLTETIASQLNTSQDIMSVDEFCSSKANNVAEKREKEQDGNGLSLTAACGLVTAGAGIGAVCGGFLGALIGGVAGILAAGFVECSRVDTYCQKPLEEELMSSTIEFYPVPSKVVKVNSNNKSDFGYLPSENPAYEPYNAIIDFISDKENKTVLAELEMETENTVNAIRKEYKEVLERIEDLQKTLDIYRNLNDRGTLPYGEYSEADLIDLYSRLCEYKTKQQK